MKEGLERHAFALILQQHFVFTQQLLNLFDHLTTPLFRT